MRYRSLLMFLIVSFLLSGIWINHAAARSNDDVTPATGADAPLLLPPNISVFPQTITESHDPGGQVTTDTFTIQNGGDSPLIWTLSEDGTGAICDAPSAISWASTDPLGATSAPGGFYTVIVTFDSTGLPNGNYTGHICIASNDPDTPLIPFMIRLVVQNAPVPNITRFPASLSESHDPGGQVTTDTFTIQNTGGADLTWSITEDGTGAVCDAPSAISWASVDPLGATSAPGGFYSVIVTFDSAGLANGTYTGNLCIASNDPDTPLLPFPLTLEVANAPVPNITRFPTSLSESHDPGGQVTTDTFTIQNTGDADLIWSITEDGTGAVCDAPSAIGWASVDPEGATSAPGGFYSVIVTFDSAGLSDGTYTGNLCIVSNDPDTPLLPFPLTLDVANAPEAPSFGTFLPLIRRQ